MKKEKALYRGYDPRGGTGAANASVQNRSSDKVVPERERVLCTGGGTAERRPEHPIHSVILARKGGSESIANVASRMEERAVLSLEEATGLSTKGRGKRDVAYVSGKELFSIRVFYGRDTRTGGNPYRHYTTKTMGIIERD